MPRYARNMALMAKVETTAGTEAAPSALTDGLLIAGDINIEPLVITAAERNLMLPYFGGSMSLLAMVSTKVSFSVELAGSGTAGTAAAWSSLLLGCAMAQSALTAPVRVEHTPVSSSLKTLTLHLNDDGVLHKLIGSMGSCKLAMKKGETPKLSFDFIGSYSPVTAVAMPALTLSAWKVPLPMAKANVTDITLGCTYSAGALSGGTVYQSNGLEIDLGNKSSFFSTLGSERAEISDRDSTCSFELELTAAQEVQAISDMRDNSTTGIGFTIGSVSGAKLLIFAPALQRTAIKKASNDGIRMIGFDGKLTPVSGNDEIRIIQL